MGTSIREWRPAFRSPKSHRSLPALWSYSASLMMIARVVIMMTMNLFAETCMNEVMIMMMMMMMMIMMIMMIMNFCRNLQGRGQGRSSPRSSLCRQPQERWSRLLSGDNDDDDDDNDDDDYDDDDFITVSQNTSLGIQKPFQKTIKYRNQQRLIFECNKHLRRRVSAFVQFNITVSH